MDRDALIAFERRVADAFNAGQIRAPIHLDGGSEDALIEIFKEVRPQDWVLCSWRSHYKALLKGVPPDALMAEILAGRSIAICLPDFRVLSSAIVGGTLPIAVGIAMGIKRDGLDERVFVFSGDMTSRTGLYHECVEYAVGFSLPITFVVESNDKSVCTPTEEAWSNGRDEPSDAREISYSYELPWPHSGAGVRVNF